MFYLVLGLLTVLASVAPAVLYSVVVWWLDRYEKEPWGLLAATFIWGALPAVLLSLVAEVIIGIPFSGVFGEAAAEFVGGSVVAPVIEELVKGFAILVLFFVFRAEFDGVLDGIVYGALVGFGFAMTENALYFLGALAEGGVGSWLLVVFVRTLVFGLNHGLFSAIVGVGLGYAVVATSTWKRWLAPIVALGAAMLVHAVHNVSASLASEWCWPVVISLANDWGGVIILLVIVVLSWDREKGWIRRELADEVKAGSVSRQQFETASSYGRRVAAQWRALSTYGLGEARRVRRFYQLMTELAFAKRRVRTSPTDRRAERTVSRLRDRLMGLRDQMAEQ